MKKIIYICLVFVLSFVGCTNNSQVVNNKNTKLSNNSINDFTNESALFDAIRAKDNDLVTELLKNDINVSTNDNYGYSPLHVATRLNQYKIVEKLINKGASVNTIDKFGDTPLIDSTRNSTNAMSKLLICNGANKNVQDMHKISPLHNASKNNDLFITMLLENNDTTKMCENLDITLISYDEENSKICGNIESGVATSVKITIANQGEENMEPYGPYDAKIDGNKYCANIDKEIVRNNEYIVTAVGENGVDIDTEIDNLNNLKVNKEVKEIVEKTDINEIYIKGLYESLMTEFSNDFDKWNAQLDKNGLVFRFKNPADLFNHGSSKLSKNFKTILSDFFPRYLKIIDQYKDQIQDVKVEGHTSSVYKSAKNDKERYSKNLKLSSKRAKNVYKYTLNKKNNNIKKDLKWLEKNYKPEGMAYDNLILDENGIEDQAASRRVEFRINKKLN